MVSVFHSFGSTVATCCVSLQRVADDDALRAVFFGCWQARRQVCIMAGMDQKDSFGLTVDTCCVSLHALPSQREDLVVGGSFAVFCLARITKNSSCSSSAKEFFGTLNFTYFYLKISSDFEVDSRPCVARGSVAVRTWNVDIISRPLYLAVTCLSLVLPEEYVTSGDVPYFTLVVRQLIHVASVHGVACAWVVLLVFLHLALFFFPSCRQAQDARRHGRYEPEGQLCGMVPWFRLPIVGRRFPVVVQRPVPWSLRP